MPQQCQVIVYQNFSLSGEESKREAWKELKVKLPMQIYFPFTSLSYLPQKENKSATGETE